MGGLSMEYAADAHAGWHGHQQPGDPFTIYDPEMHLLGNGKTYTIPIFNKDVV